MIQSLEIKNDRVTVSLIGMISVGEATILHERVFPYAEKGYVISIHLADVQQIDSSGLGALAALQRKTKQNGGHLLLTGVHAKLRDLFAQKQVSGFFEMEEG